MEIHVVHKVMKVNDEIAQSIRTRLDAAGVPAINIMSAPGSGKTTLIETAIRNFGETLRIGVVEGDPDTTRDAERIAALGAPVVQINTAGGCHLESNLVNRALDDLDLDALDLLIIENVGNLVCPVEFDLGESRRVAVISIPEGHDKPAKYPKLFRKADVVVLNKIDLLPYVDFDEPRFTEDVRLLNPDAQVLRVSCRSGNGTAEWLDWLRAVARPSAPVEP